MKYWNELNSLENALYDFEKIGASLNILNKTEDMISSPSNIPQEYQIFLQDIGERMNDTVENVKQKFQDVWDSVREDSSEKDTDVIPPWEEDMNTIDEFIKEQSEDNRWENIVNDLINWNEQSISAQNENDVWIIKEEDGNLTASYKSKNTEEEKSKEI